MQELLRQVYRISLVLHKLPKEVMTLSQTELTDIWNENVDMLNEMTTGKRKPKLYDYEKEAFNALKEKFNAK